MEADPQWRLGGTMYCEALASTGTVAIRMERSIDVRPLPEDLNRVTVARDPSSDAALAEAARNGDRRAFGVLHERYAATVHGILLARVPRHEVADLLQDVFLQALRQLHTLRDTAAFGGWLARIARNRAADFHRRQRPEEPIDENAMAARTDSSLEAQRVLSVLRTLPEAYRETLTLRLVEGMTGPEIAERTGLTPGSVRVNLHRGIQILREKLGMR
jgi:RNA polymerase sigma-70 factor (ECF subfamily)